MAYELTLSNVLTPSQNWVLAKSSDQTTHNKNPNSFRIVDEGLPTSDEEVPPSLTSDETAGKLCNNNLHSIYYHDFKHLEWALRKV